MKTIIAPIGSALLATALSVYGCHLYGMPRSELYIATIVAGGASLTAVFVATLLQRSRQK